MSFYAQGYADTLVKLGFNAAARLSKIDLSKLSPERLARANRNAARSVEQHAANITKPGRAWTPELGRRTVNHSAMSDALHGSTTRGHTVRDVKAPVGAQYSGAGQNPHFPGTRAHGASQKALQETAGHAQTLNQQQIASSRAVPARPARAAAQPQPAPVAAAQPQPAPVAAAQPQPAGTPPTFLDRHGKALAAGTLAAGGLYAATRD